MVVKSQQARTPSNHQVSQSNTAIVRLVEFSSAVRCLRQIAHCNGLGNGVQVGAQYYNCSDGSGISSVDPASAQWAGLAACRHQENRCSGNKRSASQAAILDLGQVEPAISISDQILHPQCGPFYPQMFDLPRLRGAVWQPRRRCSLSLPHNLHMCSSSACCPVSPASALADSTLICMRCV